jgi:ssRNA-specific RNase YbeY (16S rRNA maturation enzyme)
MLGWAPFTGCWIGQRVITLNNYYTPSHIINPETKKPYSPGRHWCAITVHEMGHLLGYAWETCTEWYHNCWNKDHIMHRIIWKLPSVC